MLDLTPVIAPAEILPPKTVVAVNYRAHPFRVEAARLDAPVGSTIADIVELCGLAPKRAAYVTIDGEPCPKDMWSRVRPKETTLVNVVAVPGRGAAKVVRTIISAIVVVAAAILTPILAAPIAAALGFGIGTLGATLVAGAVFSGLTVAGNLAVNALFPATAAASRGTLTSQQSSDTFIRSPTYSIGGARNEARQYSAVPVILGQHRISPPFAARPYTELVGDDQYLRLLFCVGYGPLSISDIKIGETAISLFDDVEIEINTGESGINTTALFPSQFFEESLSVDLLYSVAHTRTTAADITEISVDFVAPAGVYAISKSSGNRYGYTVTVGVYYRPTGVGSYTLAGTVTLSGTTPNAIRQSLRFTVDEGQYDVQVFKTSADYSGEDSVQETVQWSVLRGMRPQDPIAFPHPLTLIALRIKASDQLSGLIENFNCVASSLVTAWSGAAWVADSESQNPADFIRHVVQGPANERPVDDDRIDLTTLVAFHDHCTTNGYTFNQIRDFQASVHETLADIAAAGRGSIVVRDGRYSVVWETAADPIVQVFTPRNSKNFTETRLYTDLPHAWRVRFVNADNDWLQDERTVYDDGYAAASATKFEGIEFPGVTDPDLIWKHGRYHIAQARLRPSTYTLEVDFEHIVATRGDRVRISHDAILVGLGYGRVAAVAAGSPDIVALDDVVVMSASENYAIRFRLADGTTLTRTVVTSAGTWAELSLGGSGDLPAVGDLYTFGPTDLDSIVCRVKTIEPLSDLAARLILVDDAPGVLTADQGDIPAYESGVTAPPDPYASPPTGLLAVEAIVFTDGELAANVNLSWVPPSGLLILPTGYVVQYKQASVGDWQSGGSVAGTQISTVITDIAGGSWQFRVRALFGNGSSSQWSEVFNLDVIGVLAVPPDVTGFLSTASGTTLILSWTAVPDVIVRDYEIRYSPATAGVSWGSAAVLSTGVVANTLTTPFAKGTYLIKAVSHTDVVSANATSIVVTSEPIETINVVETASDDPDFGGGHDRTYYDDVMSGIILDNQTKFFAGGNFFTGSQFFTGSPGREAEGYYTLADDVDLGAVMTARLTANITVGGYKLNTKFFAGGQIFTGSPFFSAIPDRWDLTSQLRQTDDDPSGSPAWSDWVDFAIGDYTARAFQFRLKLESHAPLVTPLVTNATFTVDMPDRVITAEDIQSTVAGIAISFLPAFKDLKAFLVNGQDMAQGDYWKITDKSESGVTVTFYDAFDAMKDVKFDYQAIGYGSAA